MNTTALRGSWVPAGRTLHLIDVENLAGETHRDPSAIAQTAALYARVLEIGGLDHVWVGCHPSLVFAARQGWRVARLLPGHGPDGADLALLDAARPYDVGCRYDRVIIGSGDGRFTLLARQLRLLGVEVGVVSLRRSLAGSLRRVASFVLVLPDRSDGGRPAAPTSAAA